MGIPHYTPLCQQQHYTLPTKIRLVKAMVFPVVTYGWEGWTIKKAACWRTVVLEKTLESPLDCKEIQPVHPKGNQSWVFIGRTDAEAETPILWPPHVKTDSFEKTLMLGKMKMGGEGDDRGWDSWMASPTQWTWVWVNSGSWWWTAKPGMLQSMGSQRVRNDCATELILHASQWVAPPNDQFLKPRNIVPSLISHKVLPIL